jgi:hypothetical protein
MKNKICCGYLVISVGEFGLSLNERNKKKKSGKNVNTVDVQNADEVVTVVFPLVVFLAVVDRFVIGWPARFFQESQSVQAQAE